MRSQSQFLADLGQRIKLKRQEIGMTQVEFAKASNLKPSYYGALERGHRNISFIKLCSIAKYLGITLSELLAGVNTDLLEPPLKL